MTAPANPSAPAAISAATVDASVRRAARRAVWLKRLHQWHWISAALSLVGMLMFSFTGITLNHATDIESQPRIVQRKASLPADLLHILQSQAQAHADTRAPLAPSLQVWLEKTWGLRTQSASVEWSLDEIYVSMPGPGRDAWVRVSLSDGVVEYEQTRQGWIAWLNDLHKGRHTGSAWRFFIDAFAVVCSVFSLTGLWLLKLHASNRPSTWPVVGLGLVIPLLLLILWVHG